jgi:hypothetical protein
MSNHTNLVLIDKFKNHTLWSWGNYKYSIDCIDYTTGVSKEIVFWHDTTMEDAQKYFDENFKG